MANEENNAENPGIDVGKPAAPTVDWDDSQMRSTYANVVNASSTREEVTLFFGTNQTWNPTASKTFHVSLTDRIVLNPHAAKRLWILLGAILGEYESRFGKLNVEGASSAAATSQGKERTNGTRKRAKAGADKSSASAD
jgi:hypothetical protein